MTQRESDLPKGLSAPALRALTGAGYVSLEQLGRCGHISDNQNIKCITWQSTVNREETALIDEPHASDSSGNIGDFLFKIFANVLAHTVFLRSRITAPASLDDPKSQCSTPNISHMT